MSSKLVLCTVAAVGLLAASAQAHHAVQASVDIDKAVEVKAKLTKVDWVNPHTWMRFDIPQSDGKVLKDVMVESLGINALRRVGIDSKSALKVGDFYDIKYFPNRDGSPGGFMYKMVLPDGREFDTKFTDPSAFR